MPNFEDIRHFVSCSFFGNNTLPNPRPSLTGKTIIVTGANVGLGFEAAKHLAAFHVSTLILACRDLTKGERAATTIRASNPSTNIQVWPVDLADFSSVTSFCARVQSDLPRLDGIVLNAGVEMSQYEAVEGLERTLTVNVVGTMMMALKVLPKLQESARTYKVDTNLTIIGSLIHVFGPDGQMNVDGRVFEALSDAKTADMPQRYNLSKLILHLCFNELVATTKDGKGEGKPGVVMNLVNPGWCASELSRHRHRPMYERFLFKFMGRTTEEGSRSLVHGVVAGRETHGCYLSECVVKPQSSFVRSAKGKVMQKRLWKELTDCIGNNIPESKL
ncbi:NAD(P)-binding protein [Myriangium duriaei CBS 260.36]|uniref:NAD(P)-binding protein n=1 Tax=Myriangium duriaei CBS 260.36 TaxID=1168546 RepID=A0A9P4IXC3_9PEZI|nr:NAD(P)-binding protein [Myriangium duriaei CBS 260.36]